VEAVTPDGPLTIPCDVVLVTVGRRANTDGLAPDKAGVKVDPKGHVLVDRQLRTSNPKVFAVGDVVGPPYLAHKATKEGIIAAEVIAGHPMEADYRALPAAIFTDPEIASVGCTEAQARDKGYEVDIGSIEYGVAWNLQKTLVQRRAADAIPDTLLLLEHPHVVTLGRRGKRTDVFDSTLPVFEVERGGEATYHGPGQLVGYLILKMKDRLDVRKLVTDIEEVLIRGSRAFDVPATRNEVQRGVWVHGRKL